MPASYFTVFRWIDRAACIPHAANRIGVDPTYDALLNYIEESLAPGMTSDQVTQALEDIGDTRIDTGANATGTTSGKAVWVNICAHPLNDILLITRFGPDHQLISYDIIVE